MGRRNAVFLTGATGLIGSYLLKVFLERGHEVFCVARDINNKGARERILEIVRFWDNRVASRCEGNLHVFKGDITKRDLGMGKREISIIKERAEEMVHCAALTRFTAPLGELKEVNVEGTKNVLDLALKSQRLKKISYMSTAYVCGDYKGIFTESSLDVGQKFHNPYAKSKFEAEKLAVRYRERGLWIDIFRLPIVVGESKTGKILSFHRALYQLIRNWSSGLFSYFPADRRFFLSIVWVDELCGALYTIFSSSRRRNQTYHPFIPQRVMASKIMNWSASFLGFSPPKIVSFEEFYKKHMTPVKSNMLQYNLFFINRFVRYDNSKTLRFLMNKGFRFYRFTKRKFLNLLRYGILRRAFSKK